VTLLLVKVALAPLFVVAASLVARRFGPAVGGIVAGLPVVAGPILLAFALAHGTRFAAHAAAATLLGLLSLTAFAVTYAVVARRAGWAVTLVSGWIVFLACTGLLRPVPTNALLALVVALASLALGLVVVPRATEVPAPPIASRRWDLPLRAVAAAVLVVTLTGMAGAVGPAWSGLLTPFPIITSVLAAFTHAQAGTSEARRLLRGFLAGFVGYAFFCFTLSVSIERLGTGLAFAVATAVALATQALLLVGRRAPARFRAATSP
jgi:hypothetical protein